MKIYKFKKFGINAFFVRHENAFSGHIILGEKPPMIFNWELPELPRLDWADIRTSVIDHITFRTIYIWYGSTDCDHCYSAYATKHRNIYAFKSFVEMCYDNAEGAQSFTRMSKKEYLEERDHAVSRDYIMEAHEDGHPYSVDG